MVHDVDNTFLAAILRDVLEREHIGVCVCAPDGAIRSINASACSILGLSAEYADPTRLLGVRLGALVPEYEPLIARGHDDGDDAGVMIAIPDGEGEKRWIHNDLLVPVNGEGESFLAIVMQDLTSLKSSDHEFRRIESRMNSIIDSIPDVVYRLDAEGRITFISNAVSRYGYDPALLVGTHILDIIHPEDRGKAAFRANERRSRGRKTRAFEVRLLIRPGAVAPLGLQDEAADTWHPVVITAEGIYIPDGNGDEEFAGTQGIARNLVYRYRGHEAFTSQLDRVNAILDSLEDGYYEIDLAGTFHYVNSSFARIIGESPDDLIGMHFTAIFEKENEESFVESFREVFATEKPVKLLEWSGVLRNGRQRHMEGSISLIKDGKGEKAGFRGIIRDISRRFELEQVIMQSRKFEAIGILAGGIAHDYNNALTAILGNLSLARMEVPAGSPELVEILADAESAALKVMELTQTLSSFAKGGKPDKKQVNICALLRQAAERTLGEEGVHYRLDLPAEIFEVEADPAQLAKVFGHLMQNAREAAAENIVIACEEAVVKTVASHHAMSLQPGRYVRVLVHDDGPGIRAEDLDKVFDPYFTTKEYVSGMGLAISYAIIKRHSGYIDVFSEEGKGATFSVYIPFPPKPGRRIV